MSVYSRQSLGFHGSTGWQQNMYKTTQPRGQGVHVGHRHKGDDETQPTVVQVSTVARGIPVNTPYSTASPAVTKSQISKTTTSSTPKKAASVTHAAPPSLSPRSQKIYQRTLELREKFLKSRSQHMDNASAADAPETVATVSEPVSSPSKPKRLRRTRRHVRNQPEVSVPAPPVNPTEQTSTETVAVVTEPPTGTSLVFDNPAPPPPPRTNSPDEFLTRSNFNALFESRWEVETRKVFRELETYKSHIHNLYERIKGIEANVLHTSNDTILAIQALQQKVADMEQRTHVGSTPRQSLSPDLPDLPTSKAPAAKPKAKRGRKPKKNEEVKEEKEDKDDEEKDVKSESKSPTPKPKPKKRGRKKKVQEPEPEPEETEAHEDPKPAPSPKPRRSRRTRASKK
jgi:hypothetical protein